MPFGVPRFESGITSEAHSVSPKEICSAEGVVPRRLIPRRLFMKRQQRNMQIEEIILCHLVLKEEVVQVFAVGDEGG